MKKIDKILKKLSDLYEFHRKIKAYEFKKAARRSTKEDGQNTTAVVDEGREIGLDFCYGR